MKQIAILFVTDRASGPSDDLLLLPQALLDCPKEEDNDLSCFTNPVEVSSFLNAATTLYLPSVQG